MGKIVTLECEFYELINAFPFLKSYLNKIGIEDSKISEGQSIYDFLKKRLNYTDDEVLLTIAKINYKINLILKNNVKDSKVIKLKNLKDENNLEKSISINKFQGIGKNEEE